jgi:GT2 family glycosyltransferase
LEAPLKGNLSGRLILIENDVNSGFAAGNNIGIRFALNYLEPRYILLLNNDTVVEETFLHRLVGIGEMDEGIGAIGSTILSYDHPSEIQTMGGGINMWTGRRTEIREPVFYNGTKAIEVDYLCGACMMVRTNILHVVGLLDPDYFLYVEDVDWCFRIKKFGYRILCDTESRIWHKGSASTGGESSPTAVFYVARNGFLFMKKNARMYHLPTYILASLYYFSRSLFIASLENPKGLTSTIHGVLAIVTSPRDRKL